ncbi:MAG: hypothetical protein ACI4TS_04075 [Bacteroidaceae bacterium]
MEKETQDILQTFHQKAKPVKEIPYKLKLRNWLNGIFILLAIATIILYFVYPMPQGTLTIFSVGCAAVLIKTTEVTIRMTHKNTRK